MMNVPSPQELTRLLQAWGRGDQTARDKLLPLIYDELHQIAKRYMARQPSDSTLQTTALIHEAYLKLSDHPEKNWQNRAHFFAVAAQAMRQILVDHARARQRLKRGGAAQQVELDETAVFAPERSAELLALDEALNLLATLDPRQSRIVELRYFGGLSLEETAEVVGISVITIRREWAKAKAWLYRELQPRDNG